MTTQTIETESAIKNLIANNLPWMTAQNASGKKDIKTTYVHPDNSCIFNPTPLLLHKATQNAFSFHSLADEQLQQQMVWTSEEIECTFSYCFRI